MINAELTVDTFRSLQCPGHHAILRPVKAGAVPSDVLRGLQRDEKLDGAGFSGRGKRGSHGPAVEKPFMTVTSYGSL